jgi:hypothetical protein
VAPPPSTGPQQHAAFDHMCEFGARFEDCVACPTARSAAAPVPIRHEDPTVASALSGTANHVRRADEED